MSEILRQSTGEVSYLRRGGEGLPLVLLHGIGSNAESFLPLMKALPANLPIIAWDASGYGSSKPLAKEQPDASDYANTLADFLRVLGIPRCILLGHSLGTLIAARFAATTALQVEDLILISPTLGYGVTRGALMPTKVAARLEDLDRLGAQKFAAERAPNLVADPSAQPDVVDAVRRAMADVRRPGYDQAVYMLASGRLLDDLARVSVRTTIVVGSADRTTPPDIARQAYVALDGSQHEHSFREIQGASHAICQEQPNLVAEIVGDVIRKKVIANA